MTAQVITVTSGKGGVGKTTAVANLATALAADGRKVVCIDGDIGLRNLDVIMGLENRIVYDIVDVIEGRCKLKQAMIRDKHYPDMYLIPAAQTRDKNAVSPSDMIRICNDLRPDTDFLPSKCHRRRRPRFGRHQPRGQRSARCRPRGWNSGSGRKRNSVTDP
jgi:septum site-determining protein MinD